MSAIRVCSQRSFTLLFNDPHWIGLIELTADGSLGIVRHIVGAEPTPPEVAAFVARQFMAPLCQADELRLPLGEARAICSVPCAMRRAPLLADRRAEAERRVRSRAERYPEH